jgi:DNA primase
MRIHQNTINAVKERSDIYDLVSERIVLKKIGKDYIGLCPFHQEKSPSFSVSSPKQMYYCFGCGAAGNSIRFLMEYDKLTFSEAILGLANRYGIQIQTEDPKQSQQFKRDAEERQELLRCMELATQFYQDQLQINPLALKYLQGTRRFSAETIKSWRLGFAPRGSILLEHLTGKGFSKRILETVGLVIKRDDGSYGDRFRHRIMIPICDFQGRVVGFGGRGSKDDKPKYLNSPETPLFNKSQLLFGLDVAKNAISKKDSVIVTEGYFDVISLHQAGIENVVGVLGTSLNADHVKHLTKFSDSKTIILNFDSDEAGIKATNRAINQVKNLTYQGIVNLKVLTLPEEKDADSFLLTRSAGDYQELIEQSRLWLQWKIHQVIDNRDLPKESEKVQSEVALILREIPDGLLRLNYLQYCAEKLARSKPHAIPGLIKALERVIRTPDSIPNREVSQNNSSLQFRIESSLIRIYLYKPEFRSLLVDSLEARDLRFNIFSEIWQIVKTLPLSDVALELETAIQDKPDLQEKVSAVLFSNQSSEAELNRPQLIIRQAIASLEIFDCKERRTQLFDKLCSISDPGEIESCRIQFYVEEDWLHQLERLRNTATSDL